MTDRHRHAHAGELFRDTLIFLIVGLVGWRATRAAQMVRQYPWLYARAGPLGWREIRQENAAPKW